MKNNEFQELVDQNLSGLVWDERKRQRVLHALNEEEKPVKKFSTTFILIAAIVCLSVTALAAGLIFSRKVDDMTLASRDLEKAYGVTPTMQGSYFVREVKQTDQETVVSFEGLENLRYASPSENQANKHTERFKDGFRIEIFRDGIFFKEVKSRCDLLKALNLQIKIKQGGASLNALFVNGRTWRYKNFYAVLVLPHDDVEPGPAPHVQFRLEL